MKTHTFYWMLIVSLLGIALSACAAPATQPPATQTPEPTPNPADDPKARIVLNMAAKLTAGDIEGSLAYFKEDAMMYFIGMPPTGMEIYQGVAQLRSVWEYCVTEHFLWEVEIVSVQGDLVTAKTKTTMDFTTGLGVAPNDFVDIFQVQEGKITNYASVMTEEALAEFKPALLAVMPAEPVDPVTADPVSEITITFANGTCTHSAPLVFKAGELTVNAVVQDTGAEKYAVSFFSLEEGKDMVDLMASSLRSGPPSWSKTVLLKELQPGQTESYTFTAGAGSLYLVCWSGLFDLPIGNAGPFDVR